MVEFESGSLSYLKLFWGSQILVVGGTALVKLITGSWDKTSNHKPEDAKLGILQFRKRPAVYYSAGFLFTSWTAWNAFSAYHFGTTPNYYLSQLFDKLTTPCDKNITTTGALLASTLLQVHFIRRLYETLEVSILSHRQVVSVGSTVSSCLFGGGAIMSVFAEAPEFSSQSLSINMSSIGKYQIVAVALYGIGTYLQRKSLEQLADERRNKFGHITSTNYKLPTGSLFLVTYSPHYMAEIMIYASVAMAMDAKNATWLWLLSYVTANQLFMAWSNRMFYCKKDLKMTSAFKKDESVTEKTNQQ